MAYVSPPRHLASVCLLRLRGQRRTEGFLRLSNGRSGSGEEGPRGRGWACEAGRVSLTVSVALCFAHQLSPVASTAGPPVWRLLSISSCR